MNERVKDEYTPPKNVPVIKTGSASSSSDLFGLGVRIDPPHTLPPEMEARQVEWQNLEHFVPVKSIEPASAAPNLSKIDNQIQKMDDWGQVARNLRIEIEAQQSSLDQQKQELRLRISRFNEEQQRFQHIVANEQSQLDAKKNQFLKSESEFHERFIEFEIMSRKLEVERKTFDLERAELERRRNSLQDEVRKDLMLERNEIEQKRLALKKDLDHAQVLKEALKSRLDSLASENERTLKAERESLWRTLTEEWEQRKLAFENESEAWVKSRDLEKSEIDREKAMFESAVERANAEFVKAREDLEIELDSIRHQQTKQIESERLEWEQKRQTLEADFATRSEALEADLKSRSAAHSQELETLRERTLIELRADREQWKRQREEEEAAVVKLREAMERHLAESHDEQATAIRAEREQLEEAQKQFETESAAQQAELLAVREALKIEIIATREQHAIELQVAQEEWQKIRDLEKSALEEQEAELIAAREQFQLMLTTERDDWNQFQENERLQFEAQQAEWFASRDSMLQSSRDALEVEFISLREQHAAKLKAERDEWEQDFAREKALLEEQNSEFVRERNLIENRIRFQQDHLDKSRADFEQLQNEARRERQIEMQQLEETNMLLIRRMKQIDLYRTSIDAREKSLDREHEVFSRTRKALSNTADLDRMNFQAERHAWEQERQTQQNELRRQQEVLAVRAEGLESRQGRLDKLRAELEETHRATLEMRLALEEAWAQLTRVAGEDEARKRVDQVRHSLAGYYQQMHDTLAQQRREHVESLSKFERQRAEFTDERLKLTSWLTKRDEDLRLGEERLRIAAIESTDNHNKWLAARDRWLIEKTEAEQLIRRLLSSLGENNREQSGEFGAVRRLDEIKARFDDPFAKQS